MREPTFTDNLHEIHYRVTKGLSFEDFSDEIVQCLLKFWISKLEEYEMQP